MRTASTVNRAALLAPVALLLAACAADEPAGQRLSEAELRSTNVCDFREGGSRWAPSLARYEMTAEFGRSEESYLVELQGVAISPAGDVFVYDAGGTHVVKLDSDLRLIETIGREGQGPGEFTYQRVGSGDWIAADDSSIYVLDVRVLSTFDLSGEFRGYAAREVPHLHPGPIRRIAARNGRVVYAVDAVGREDGTRTLQTWRFEPTRPHTLLRTDSMPTIPVLEGRAIRATFFIGQADPLWTMRGRCAFISDGAGDWILRVDLDTNRADTLYIPDRALPKLTEEDEAWLESGRRAMVGVGGRHVGGVQPTAPLKWDDIVVDPDGFVWLEPWRPRSMEGEPFTAWVVHPATGAVDSVVVEEFPDAFLPGGAFISRVYDRAAYLTLVRKYSLASEGE